jgi:hypothetical protein
MRVRRNPALNKSAPSQAWRKLGAQVDRSALSDKTFYLQTAVNWLMRERIEK